eukprot:gene4328-7684_t
MLFTSLSSNEDERPKKPGSHQLSSTSVEDFSSVSKKEIHISILGSERSGKTTFVKSQILGAKLNGASYEDLDVTQKSVLNIGSVSQPQMVEFFIHEPKSDIKKQYNEILELSEGFILIYDINDHLSFEEVKYHVSDIEENNKNEITELGIILIGNKNDLVSQKNKRKSVSVGEKQGKNLIPDREIPFFECCATNGNNIDKSFQKIIHQILKNRKKKEK